MRKLEMVGGNTGKTELKKNGDKEEMVTCG
jgi:hypothetical protein